MTKEDYFKYYIQGTDHYLIPKDVFNELFNEMSNWKEEAKELKKQLEDLQETHYLIQGGRSNGKTYLMKLQADKEQLNSLVNSCQEEIRRLKKQLEEYKEQVHKGLYNTCLPYKTGYDKAIKDKENQQKEFIDYLTLYIELLNNKPDLIEEGQQDILKEVFDKFKEIKGELK